MSYNCENILYWTETQLKYKYDVSLTEASANELHNALGEAVMMAIHENWSASKAARATNRKAYYISAEFLIGRLVYSNLFNLGILDEMKKLFAEKGVDLAILEDVEDDALGNGGLGRLAACFMDSAASCDLPLSGYGLRYKHGLFKQGFDEKGNQTQIADDWTAHGDPWSFRRDKHTVTITFPDHTVKAVPYDVPVIGYGTKTLPAFYTSESGFGVDYQIDTPEELAAAFKAGHDMGMKSGMLVTNPIPQEFAMPKDVIDAAIDQAIAECNAKGIHGKETTPFLLARVAELTGGDSLASNIRLVFNNAKVAAQTAVAYCKL